MIFKNLRDQGQTVRIEAKLSTKKITNRKKEAEIRIDGMEEKRSVL